MKKLYYEISENHTNYYTYCKYIVYIYDYDYSRYDSFRTYYFEKFPSTKSIRNKIIDNLLIYDFKITKYKEVK